MSEDYTFDDAALLIGLGAPRTGGTWLVNYFFKHPEILMSPVPRLNFWHPDEKLHTLYADRLALVRSQLAETPETQTGGRLSQIANLEDRVAMGRDVGAYLDFFRRRWNGEKVFADMSSSYFKLGRDEFARMRDSHPRVLFLFVMRNPIDRYWSGRRLRKALHPDLDLYADLENELTKPNWPAWQHIYVDTVTGLDAAVPPQNVRLAFFEDQFEMTTMHELCDFLGVRTELADVDKVINSTPPAKLDFDQRRAIYSRLESVYRFVYDRFEGRLPASWLRDMEAFTA